MKRAFGSFVSATPYGELLFSEVSDSYAMKVGADMERGEYEKEVAKVILEQKCDHFIDVGAAFGYFTLLASTKGVRVTAFEAHPLRFGYLHWNTNHCSGVRIIPAFVGYPEDDVYMTSNPSGLIGKKVGSRIQTNFSFPRVKLSSHVNPKEITLIKVDVEGFEKEVIETLDKSWCLIPNIKWIIEIHTNLVNTDDILKPFAGRRVDSILQRGSTHTVFVD